MSFSNPKLIEAIPQAVLEKLPAAAPPVGVVPNFADPATRVPVILGISITFFVLAVVCFMIRIYTRIAIKNWRWDDLTCALGFMFSLVYFGAVINGCLNGPTGRHQWEMYLSQVLGKASLYQSYITVIMATPALGLIKLSLFIQYYLLFSLMRWVRISVWIGATLSGVFYITVSIVAFVLCSPWHGETMLETILSGHYFKFAQFSIPTGVISMLMDWYLLILPIPAVLALQMSTAKKIGVLIIFMTGGLAAIASMINLYYRVKLQNDPTDTTWKVGYVVLWTQIETFAGVAASSMPTVHQFFSQWSFSLASWKSSLKSNLIHLPGRNKREKLSDDHQPGFTAWPGDDVGGSRGHKGARMNGLDLTAYDRLEPGNPRVADPESQIHLSHFITVTREQLPERRG